MSQRLSPRRSALLALLLLAGLVLLFFWKVLLTNLILIGGDTFLYFYPYRAYTAAALLAGRLPLWNPHLFMGAPLLANSQAGVLYPLNWLFLALPAPKQVAWSAALHVWIAGAGMLAYTRRCLRLSWPGAFLAAMLFALGGFLGAQVDHPNQLHVSAWLPWLLLLTEAGATWGLAAVIALMLLAGHTQTVYISLVGVGGYGVFSSQLSVVSYQGLGGWWRRVGQRPGSRQNRQSLISNPLISRLGLLLTAVLLALLLAAVQLLPTLELAQRSIRRGGLTFNEATSFSLRPWTAHFTFLPPYGLDLVAVFGEAFSEWIAYAGLAGLGLALVGLLTMPWRREARTFALLGGLGVILALGRVTGPLYLFLYKFVPGFNLFRAPARWLLLYALAVAVLAGLGLDALGSQPQRMSQTLKALWDWVRGRRLAWLALAGLGLLSVAAARFVLEPVPPGLLLSWLAGAGLVASLIGLALRRPDRAAAVTGALLLLAGGELFWAAQSLRYSRPTAPEAYASLRPAITQLRAAAETGDGQPYRFLSLSGIVYDPGDLAELEAIYGDQLPPEAVYQLVVAAKEKEVLFFNLPLQYGLYSVDGYDGGLLPLARFVDVQRLFLDADHLSLDGRLRENLRQVPPGRLLSLLGVRYILTDKVFDVWIDDIFYDLQFSARLGGGGPDEVQATDLPAFPATALGLVSYLEGGEALPDGAPVADVVITGEGGAERRFTLRAGFDTAEGKYPAGAAHRQARIGHTWRDDPAGFDYVTVLGWDEMEDVRAIRLSRRAALRAGPAALVVRGLSLINGPTTTSRSILLTTEGDYRLIHSGDVKVYENLGVLPRAFVVHELETVPAIDAALARLRDPGFDPARRALRLGPTPGLSRRGSGGPAAPGSVVFRTYRPEQVEIEVDLAEPGWLILTDAAYPGWAAAVDGQPVAIETVDVMFRAVEVPAGRHRVSFVYRPGSFRAGAWISGAAWLGWLLLIAWPVRSRLRGRFSGTAWRPRSRGRAPE